MTQPSATTANHRSSNRADSRDTVDDEEVAAAYALLIQQPGLDLERFAARLGRSDEDVRAILNRFTDLALLYQAHSEQDRLVPASPIAAMQRLIARERSILKQRQQFLEQSASTLSLILSTCGGGAGRGDADGPAEELSTLASARRRLEELAMAARQSLLSISPSAAAGRANRRPIDLGALARGVRLRAIYPDSVLFEPEALGYAQELVRAGGEVHIVAAPPVRMTIVDGELALVPRDPQDDAAGALVVRQKTIVQALVALFESCWHQGWQLSEADSSLAGCNSVELAVVRLLATGAKDDAVARHLGTSVRTVRRVVADLMSRAGVSSRFAFGVYAAGRDWL